jgi:hypothetical protein
VESASEFRGLDPVVLLREKRVRNRETADVGGVGSNTSCCGGGDSARAGLRTGGVGTDSKDIVRLGVDCRTGDDGAIGVPERVGTELLLSTLARADPTPPDEEANATEALLGGPTGEAERLELTTGGDTGPLRPKKDSRPPVPFFLPSIT